MSDKLTVMLEREDDDIQIVKAVPTGRLKPNCILCYEREFWRVTSIQTGDSGDLAGLAAEWREQADAICAKVGMVIDTDDKIEKVTRYTTLRQCAWELEARTAAAPLPTEAGEPLGQQKE